MALSEAEFTRRVLAIEGKLYRVSLAIMGSDADSKDATQEALCRAWLCHDKLRDEAKFEGWLMRILVNECKALMRKHKRRQSLLPALEPAPDTADVDWAVREALFQLEDRLRLPVMLHYVEGYGVEEIAAMLDARPGTVKSWLYQGRAKLRDLLGEGGDEA